MQVVQLPPNQAFLSSKYVKLERTFPAGLLPTSGASPCYRKNVQLSQNHKNCKGRFKTTTELRTILALTSYRFLSPNIFILPRPPQFLYRHTHEPTIFSDHLFWFLFTCSQSSRHHKQTRFALQFFFKQSFQETVHENRFCRFFFKKVGKKKQQNKDSVMKATNTAFML